MELILILALSGDAPIIETACVDARGIKITCPSDAICVEEINGKQIEVPCPKNLCFKDGVEIDCK